MRADTECATVKGCCDARVGLDFNGVVTAWNKTAEHLFGYAQIEAMIYGMVSPRNHEVE